MENLSELENYMRDLRKNVRDLEEEVLMLKDLRYAGHRRFDEWLKDASHKAVEVENLRKELNQLKTGIGPIDVSVKLAFTIKMMELLKDIRLLSQEANGHPESVESLLLELGLEKPKQYSYEDLSSFTSNFSIKVGQGASAHVYKGQLPSGLQVAVKVLVEHDVVKEMFMAEVRTMGRTYHRNLIKLYGFCFDQHNRALVYEYMENGSLDRVLYQNHHTMEWEKLYGIATDIAKAIAYLHDGCSEQIVHYDIKAANVLLDSKFSPKITDFGLAKLLNRDRSHLTLSRIRGTPGYLAPEMWMPTSLITYKCDVYSYGMLLFEVLGRRNNSRNNNQWFPKQVWDKFETGQFGEILDECGIRENNREKATVLSMVAFWCAQFTAQVRPTMSTVVKMLENEIPVKMPPNPFFPSNFVSSIQHLPNVDHPKVSESVPLQPSHQPEVINPMVDSNSLQPSDMPAAIHPKLTASISVQPSDFLEVTGSKVNAFFSPQSSDFSEVILPEDAFFSMQTKFGASSSTQPSDSGKTVQPKTTHSADERLLRELQGMDVFSYSVEKAPEGTPSGGGVLVVIIHEAENVEGKHHTNPYVRVLFRGEERKTKRVKKNRDPRWDEEFHFMLEEPPTNDRIHIEVVSASSRMGILYRKECLGYVDILLPYVVSNKRVSEKWYLIDSKNGRIRFELQWRTRS